MITFAPHNLFPSSSLSLCVFYEFQCFAFIVLCESRRRGEGEEKKPLGDNDWWMLSLSERRISVNLFAEINKDLRWCRKISYWLHLDICTTNLLLFLIEAYSSPFPSFLRSFIYIFKPIGSATLSTMEDVWIRRWKNKR